MSRETWCDNCRKLIEELANVRREAIFAINKAQEERNQQIYDEGELNGYSRGVADTEVQRESDAEVKVKELQVWIERFASLGSEDSGETPEIIFDAVEEMIGNIRAIFPEQIAEDLYEAMDGESHWDDHDCDLEQLHTRLTDWKRLAKAQEVYRTIICEKKCTNLNIPCLCPVAKERLDEALGGQPPKGEFKAYLRCKEPSEQCSKCEFLKQCEELNYGLASRIKGEIKYDV